MTAVWKTATRTAGARSAGGASSVATGRSRSCWATQEVTQMRKTLLGLGLVAILALAAPRAADAGVSISIGLPGVHIGAGFHPPVVYGPAYAYGPPVYYRHYAPRVYYRGHYHHAGCHHPRRRYYRHKYYDRHYDRRYRHWDD